MYVCNCHKVTDHQIKEAMDSGFSTLSELQTQLNVGTNCGSCIEHAMMVMQSHQSEWSKLDYNLAFQAA